MNNLKKIILTILLFASAQFYAQKKHDHERIKSLKIAFITERLDLSTKEAQAFWPIYNKYQEGREALRQKKRKQIRSKMRESENLTEKEAHNLIKQHLVFEEEEEELDKNFIQEVAKVISAKKTVLLLRSEEEFKRQLIKQYRHKNVGNR